MSDLVVSDSLHGEGNGTPLQYSCLENPMDGGTWWAAIYGVAQSWTRLKWLSSSSRLFATPWTLAYQVPPSMGFSRQNFPGVNCHFLFQGILSNPGIELRSTALQVDTLWSEPLWYFLWDWKVVLYYELLLENKTINSKKYCSQLDQLKAALNKKQGISQQKTYLSRYFMTSCFFDDQAKTVTTWLGSSDFSLYSPHIASYVVHLFWSLQNSLTRQNFHSLEDCKRHLQQFFAQKD